MRFHTFGDPGIGFSVILRAQEFVDQYLIKHEFVKRLHRRFAAEGIAIPIKALVQRHDRRRQPRVKACSAAVLRLGCARASRRRPWSARCRAARRVWASSPSRCSPTSASDAWTTRN